MKLLPFRDGEFYGLADVNGNIVIHPEFSYAGASTEGVVVATGKDDELVLIDVETLARHIAVPWEWESAEFQNGLLAVRKRGVEVSGYIDKSGNTGIEARFSIARPFDRVGATVKLRDTDLVVHRIDRTGQTVGQPFLDIRKFHPHGTLCGARISWGDSGMVLINGTGERITSRTFAVVWQEHEGLVPVEFHHNSVGWIDSSGEVVHQLNASGIGNHFESGLVPVETDDGKWGLMNLDGESVIASEFDVIESVGPNRFMFGNLDERHERSVKLADGCGNYFGDEAFLDIGRFVEGFASVWRIKKKNIDTDDELEFNFIDMNGVLVFSKWS